MRLLLCNNFVRGGSGVDVVVRLEESSLRAAGHEVVPYARENREFEGADAGRRARLLLSAVYSRQTVAEVKALLEASPFDVVHVHNTVPLVSDSIYKALRSFGGMVIQHLHNYRSFCPSSYAFRDGRPCRLCVRTGGLACIGFRCYRDSFLAGAGLVAGRWVGAAGTRLGWRRPDLYVAVSEAVREACVREGLPSERVVVLPNPVRDMRAGGGSETRPGTRPKLVFVGSFLEAKGVFLLPELARHLPLFELHMIGAGADEDEVRRAAGPSGKVIFHGLLDGEALRRVWADAFLTLVPSQWDEPFGLVAAESFSLGIPVVTTGRGALGGMVTEGVTGLVGPFCRAEELASRITALWNDPDRYARMSAEVRRCYEEDYTPSVFTRRLLALITRWQEQERCA